MPAKEVIIIASLIVGVLSIKSVRDIQSMWHEERTSIEWANTVNRSQPIIDREWVQRNGDPVEAFARRYAAEKAAEQSLTLAEPADEQ